MLERRVIRLFIVINFSDVTSGRDHRAVRREKQSEKADNPNHLKGDYSQYQLAKYNRDKKHKSRQIELFMAADVSNCVTRKCVMLVFIEIQQVDLVTMETE